jgi:lysophospholipase L1-like esterase
MTDVEIMTFGDSITLGVWDKEGGWVQRLRNFLEKKNSPTSRNFYYPIYNLGVDADTTASLLDRIENDIKKRLVVDTKLIIIIKIGEADSCLVKNNIRTPIKIFEKNINKIFAIAKKYSPNIIFVGLNPVDESKAQPVWWNEKLSFSNEKIREYELALKKACILENIPFVSMFDEWMKLNYKKLLEDGVHPNSKGHQKIFETLKNYLIENKII